MPAQRSTIPSKKSRTFAGYSIHERGEGSWKVAAQFVVPKVKCTGGSGSPERAIDPSVGVYKTSTKFSSAGVFVGCFKGKAHYLLAFVLNGSDHNYAKLAPRPGDKVAVRVSQTSKSTVLSSVDKSRNSVKKTLKGAGSVSGGAPWVGDSGWKNPRLLGVPNFRKLHFSDASVNGAPFGSSGAVVRYYRARRKAIQIATRGLAHKTSFKTVFKHS